MALITTGLGGPQGVGEGSFRGSTLTTGNYDDGSIKVDITSVFGPSGIDYFGTNYTSIYINTNGLITFGGPVTTYTPTAISSLNYPAIAPFFTDVNITSGSATGLNNIYWDLDPASGKVTVTWLDVRAYSGSAANTNTFQLVLSSTGSGNFEVEFIYQQIEWTNGYTGVAQIGLTDGGVNDYVVPGSGNSAAIQQYPTNDFATDDPNGVWSIRIKDGNPVCFVAGTLIDTPSGRRPIEALQEGDLVLTADHGAQPIRWIGGSHLLSVGNCRPIRIRAGHLDNDRELQVSRRHLLRVAGAPAELIFGEDEVFVAACDLIDGINVEEVTSQRTVTYYHLLLGSHEVVLAEGCGSESLRPGPQAMDCMGPRARAELAEKVGKSELARMGQDFTARRVLKSREACVLRAALAKPRKIVLPVAA